MVCGWRGSLIIVQPCRYGFIGSALNRLGFHDCGAPITLPVRGNGSVASERCFPAKILGRQTPIRTRDVPAGGLSARITVLPWFWARSGDISTRIIIGSRRATFRVGRWWFRRRVVPAWVSFGSTRTLAKGPHSFRFVQDLRVWYVCRDGNHGRVQ